MPLVTIQDVISELHSITQQCIQTSAREGYFAALYKRMTMAVANGITEHFFEDGLRMEQLDIHFATRYLNAIHAFKQQQPCTASWQFVFSNNSNKALTVIQHLLMGINTHINLDLAIAAAAVAPGKNIYSLENDFNKINTLITGLIDDVQQCLAKVWLPMQWLNQISNQQQLAVLNFSIGAARTTSWANALILANLAPAQQQAYIMQMDETVLQLCKRIQSPRGFSNILMKTIRLTEYSDVGKTIGLIENTIV